MPEVEDVRSLPKKIAWGNQDERKERKDQEDSKHILHCKVVNQVFVLSNERGLMSA